MSMKIQKGLVKDQGFQDTTCTYGICDDGRVYYFLENGTLENGNIIASTNLKEAIGHTPSHTSLGLIDSDSNILIPFENRTIKLVDERFLLVEKATPVSESVVEAMRDRADPLAANKLVTTAADNKDKMNAKMGRDGKFIFNNQFSEATIFDIDGNQVDNDYYSYIAMDEDTIYFSKNIMDFPIVEYPINAPLKMNPQVAGQVDNQITLDVTNTGVVQDSVEKAFNEQIEQAVPVNDEVSQVQDNTSMSNEINPNDNVSAVQNNEAVNPISVEDNKNSNQSNETVNSYVDNVEVAPVEVPVSTNSDFSDISSDFNAEKQNDIQEEDTEVKYDEVSTSQVASTIVDNEEVSKVVEKSSIFNEDSPKNSINFNEIKNESIKTKSVDNDFDRKFEEQDTVIENANNVMKRLIKQNKDQKDTIKNQDIKIESLEQDNKMLMTQCEDMTNQNEDLNRKILRYETIIEKYAKKLNSLSDKVDNQAKTIASQQKRLDILEPQIAGRAQLGDTVEEAMEILNDEDIDHVYTKFAA